MLSIYQMMSITIKLTNIKMIIIMLFLFYQVVRRVDRPRPLKLSAANRYIARVCGFEQISSNFAEFQKVLVEY